MTSRAPASLSISTLAELSGVSAHLIRAWERRYSALRPARAAGGRRLYGQADVQRLVTLRRLVASGHAIGAVATLSDRELEQLARPEASPPSGDISREGVIAALRAALLSFDAGEANRLLGRAQLALTPVALMEGVLAPLLAEIGDRWASGEISVAEERAASTVIRAHLVGMLRAIPEPSAAHTVLSATLEGEYHDIGALFAALAAAGTGRRVVFLSGSLPPAEIALACARARSNVVLLSFAWLSAREGGQQLRALRSALPKPTRIIIGGSASRRLQLPDGVERVDDLPGLVATL